MLYTAYLFTFKSQYVVEEFTPTKSVSEGNCNTIRSFRISVPVCDRGQILMQEAWICGVDWDDPLPNDLVTRMISWFAELQRLPEIKVPRCLQHKEEVRIYICSCVCGYF